MSVKFLLIYLSPGVIRERLLYRYGWSTSDNAKITQDLDVERSWVIFHASQCSREVSTSQRFIEVGITLGNREPLSSHEKSLVWGRLWNTL